MVDHKRQRDLYNPDDHDVPVTIVGLGNIGSHTALALARMGIKRITLYDADTIESHNLSSQAYRIGDVGKQKADVLKEMIHEVSNAQVVAHNAFFTGHEEVEGIVVIAVDSLDTRREIARNIHRGVYVIDGRMGGGQVEVHAQKAGRWLRTIPEQGDNDPCSARYISYTSYIIAGAIANTVKRFILSQRDISRLVLHTDTYQIIAQRYEPTHTNPERIARVGVIG